MNTKFVAALCLSAAFLCGFSACAGEFLGLPFSIEPQHPRSIKIGKKPVMVLKPGSFEIVVGEGSSPAAVFGAQELADALSLVFGTKIGVQKKPSGGKIEIRPGDLELAGKLGVDVSRFDRDGFVIRTAGKKILIIGRDRCSRPPRLLVKNYGDKGEWATLFGVYDFLERFAGVRYYFPTPLGTYAPKAAEIKLPEIDIYDRPDFLQRRYSTGDVSRNRMLLCKGWDVKLDQLRNRLETLYIPVLHGLAYLGFYHRFGKSHPEYFLLQANGKRMIKLEFFRDNSQICISSGIRDEIVRDAISFLKKEPAEVRGIRDWKGRVHWNGGRHPQNTCLFDIMFNDAIITCHCRECWKHFSQGPQETSDYVWSFFNGIARKVKDSGTPGYLTTMAYADYKLPPRMPIEKNLLVMVAITGPWAEFRPEKRKEDMERLAKWHEKLGQKTWLYTYAGKFKEGRPVGIPHTTPRALGAFVKQARPHIFGFYLSNYCDRIFYNYLTNYVYGKLSWNTELDVEQLLDEHARNLYGPAAGPIREFFETVEKIWGRIASNVEETPLGPVFMFPTDAALWSEFYTPAVRKRFAALFAEAERLAKNDPTVAARIRLLKQEMYQPMLDEARRFEEINDAAAAWSCHFPERKLPVKIDGRPEEPAWRDAASFYLHGLKGALAEVRSVVKVMRDKENFYFAFECEEPQTQRMESNRHPKDGPVWKDCTAEVFLSPDGNRQHCYQLMVNPNGAFGDLEVFRDPRRNNARYDYKWESGAEVKCSVTPGKAWYAEMRVPRSAMCAAMPEGILANFARHRVLTGGKREEQFYVWSPFVRSFGDTELFGSLKFEPEPGKNLIADPDFAGKVLPRRTFGKWWSTEPLKRDEKIFVTCGSSVRQEGGKKSRQLIQYLPALKPETVYELSFFVRMDKVERQPGMPSWHVRVDMGDNRPVFHPQFPESLHGTFPWRRQRFLIKTGTAQGSAGKPYVNFVLKPNSGTVWIDNVKFVEVPQK